jgi:hypothetical protein
MIITKNNNNKKKKKKKKKNSTLITIVSKVTSIVSNCWKYEGEILPESSYYLHQIKLPIRSDRVKV